MKVKLTVSRAGVNFTQEKGDIIDVDAAEAGRMFASGQCSFSSDDDQATAVKAAEDYWAAKKAEQPANAAAEESDEDDDSDAINGDASVEETPGETGLKRAKAKRAKAEPAA